MLAAIAALSLVARTPLHHRVELTPERVTLGQCEPLLVRVTLTHGWRRPARLAGHFGPEGGGFSVQARSPLPEAGWRSFGAWRHGLDCSKPLRPTTANGVPGARQVGYLWLCSSANQWDAFAGPGTYQVRAVVRLVDADGKQFTLTTPAKAVRVTGRDRDEISAAAGVREILERRLSFSRMSGGGTDELIAALPTLGDGGTASAVRRLLALDALHAAGDDGAALAEAEALRVTLPPMGRDEFPRRVAGVVARRGRD